MYFIFFYQILNLEFSIPLMKLCNINFVERWNETVM